MPYLVVFRLEFEKSAIVTFDPTSNFSKRKFFENLKSINLGREIPYLGIFR